ncbi:MAG TPA: ABC-2 transporter permease [Chthoniobacterales bacterium]|nr:ABC-2 transporter permease [Chthoniobacterales bacterium]
MNNEPNNVLDAPFDGPRNALVSATRPFYWSVRRELWENRSIYLAPLIAAGVVLFGYGMTVFNLPQLRRNALALEPTRMRAAIEMPYDAAAMMIMFTVFIVGIFYCLDAIYGERRDRSILFWKSLPVSDRTSVLSKAIVPLAILPLLTFVIVIATQFVMLLLSTVLLLPSGLAGTTWQLLPLPRLWSILFYGLVTSTLWEAPVYAWLLLVSSWARRATFLWAVLPWLAISAIEKLAFDTTFFIRLLGRRLTDGFQQGFVVVHYPSNAHVPIVDRLTQFAPLKFLTNPELWIGLVVAVVFLIAAIRLRRSRGPL